MSSNSPAVISARVRPRARGANLDGVRRSNLSNVLRLVHVAGQLSRADLVRETGLNRSTIADIVSELECLDLVVESPPLMTTSVGRPSFVIVPTRTTVAIAVNPEVDAVTIGVVAMNGMVLRSVRFEHAAVPAPDEVGTAISSVLSDLEPELRGVTRVIGLGLAIPGLVQASSGIVTLAPHLEWHDVPFAADIETSTGYRTHAANDAGCGAVAEHLFGAGRGVGNLVSLNGGASGIGGGVIIDGSPMSGASGFAGEFGHTLVNSDGVACHCGANGCLETEVRRDELLAALDLDPDEADQLQTRLVARFAGDIELRRIVDRQVSFLAVALRNIVNSFNPERIVLGGFLADLHAVAGDRLALEIRRSALRGAREEVQLVPAELGRENLLVGAAELAFAAMFADPASVGVAGAIVS